MKEGWGGHSSREKRRKAGEDILLERSEGRLGRTFF